MDNKIWMYSVFIFLVLIAPVLLIMMLLVLTNIPLYFAFLGWLPISIAGSWMMIKWARRESNKIFDRKNKSFV
jgi:membrane protein implicated in regulation of membrane protease activity